MKNRRHFFNLLGLALLMFVFYSQAALSFECQVDGHGPYDLSRKKCFQLGRQQAKTNCILKEKQAEVVLQFTNSQKSPKKLESAVCRSQPQKFKNTSEDLDCTQAICQNSADTAQH